MQQISKRSEKTEMLGHVGEEGREAHRFRVTWKRKEWVTEDKMKDTQRRDKKIVCLNVERMKRRREINVQLCLPDEGRRMSGVSPI